MEFLVPARSLSRQSLRIIKTPRAYTPSCRSLHSSTAKRATPIAHPAAPGSPPDPPSPAVSEAHDRVARKLRQAELLKKGQGLRANPAKPAAVLKKRFWKDVAVKETADGYQVFLDSRPVRTPNKDIITIPRSKHALAVAIALEWDQLVSVQQATKHHYIPLTSLTARAMDIQSADKEGNPSIRNEIVKMLMRYLTTDTLLCWAPEKNMHDAVSWEQRDGSEETLRGLQIRTANPIIAYLTSHVWPGVETQPILDPDSIMPLPQPEATKDVILGWLAGLPAFELAGIERAVLATKSFLVATRLLVEWSEEFRHLRENQEGESRFGIEEAAQAATLEVRWQTGMWGEVEDTHDVEKEDIRRQLGSTVILVSGSSEAEKR